MHENKGLLRKTKCFLDFDKEEAWLRNMSIHGWALVQKSGAGNYAFTATSGCEYVYRIDYRTFKTQTDYQDYLALFSDAGWGHVCGSKNSGIQYFVAMNETADHEIFSDGKTRAARYRARATAWGAIFVAYLANLIVLGSTGKLDPSTVLNPASFYFTPGLWESTGGDFWFSFLFETPFALMRGYWWLLFLPLLTISAFYLIASWKLNKRDEEKA